MHPAMQRRRHRLMVRRTTRRGNSRRGLTTAFLVMLGVFVLFVGGSVAATAGGALAAYSYFQQGLPDPRILDDIKLPASTYVYDRTGKTLLARFECQNREQVRFSELPDNVVNATVAAEDRTFWTNDGIDYRAVVGAAIDNLQAGQIVRGASTITAQVIKYAGSIKQAEDAAASATASAAPSEVLDPQASPAASESDVCQPPKLTFLEGRGYQDKIQEFILAREVTAAYPGRAGKQKILETYLNLIFYGNGSYGIKAAAANYFGISDLSQLSLAQSAFLAGLPQLPSAYDPYFNDQGPDRAIARRNTVLEAMLRDNYITQRQYAEAKATTWEEMGPSQIRSILKEPLFSLRVRREAASILASMGVPNPEEAVRTGGYRIKSTLDYGLQQKATELVAYQVHRLSTPSSADCRKCDDLNVHNAAMVSIDSTTGEIVAYVGSVDYWNRDDPRVKGQFDVAGQTKRQPGSAFKAITYSSAFVAREATPATFLMDSVIQFGSDRATSYMPTNAGITDHGPLLAMDALHFSLNVPSVQMQYLVGEKTTAAFAEKMGIDSADYINGRDPGLTLTLGSVEVNLTTMTNAFGVFADQGTLNKATTIMEIRDRNNRVIYTRADDGTKPTQPMTPAEAYLTHWILNGNTNPRVNPIWGPPSQLLDPSGNRREAGFKTGTTNDFRDVTGFGYVPGGLVTGVWMGNSDYTPMSNVITGRGLFSADGPMYLWHDFMDVALNQPWDWNGQKPAPNRTFEQPSGIVVASVCRFSGMAATSNCGQTIKVPFLEGTVPPPDNVHSKGCFDPVQEVRQDDRRPQEWVEAAQSWVDRYVNGETGQVGDPTKLKEHPEYHLKIGYVPGTSSHGDPICGERRATPTPAPTDSGGGGGGGGGGPKPTNPAPTPAPSKCKGPSCPPNGAPTGSLPGTGTDVALLVPIFGATTFASIVPLVRRARRRLRRR